MARHQAAVDSFVERYAADLEAAGIPRLPARVFVALLVEDDGYLSAAELARASTSARRPSAARCAT